MENRERDRVSQRTSPTDAGKLNRGVEAEKGRAVNSGASAEFGQSIGRSENLHEGGEMRNRYQDDMSDENTRNDPGRNSGSGSMGSSSGRKSSSDTSDVSSDENSNRGSSGELGSNGTGSSEGRH